MSQITSYTTTEAIRASLGIDAEDCPDSYMENSNLELELLVDLDGWLPTHATIFSDGNQATPLAAQRRARDVLVLYSQWFCAYEMAKRFLTFPQIVSDGKNQLNRFPKVDLEKVAEMAAAQMAKYKGILEEEVLEQTPSYTPNILIVSTPADDPVSDVLDY